MLNQDTAKAGIEASLKKSGLEYFDLYLLHRAMRDYFSAWRALEDAYEEEQIKSNWGFQFLSSCSGELFVKR